MFLQSAAYSAASTNSLDTNAFIQEQTQQALPYISSEIPTNSDELVRVIVQLSSQPAAVGRYAASQGITNLSAESAELTVQAEQTSFIAAAHKKGVNFNVNYLYDTVLNGMEITLPASQVRSLAALPGVKSIHENHTYYSIPDVQPIPSDVLSPNYEIAPLSQIGATDAWAKGLTGKGLKIGVIDTGVDYHHPDLVGAYKGGYDSFNNDADPFEDLPFAASEDPLHGVGYDGSYHGTHVAGTIVGQARNLTSDIVQKGVAYEAELYAYKVLGKTFYPSEDGGSYKNSGSSAQVIDGIERAVKDGMDVINLSLGSDITKDVNSLDAIAINNAVLSGVVAVVANGNAGPEYYSMGSPASAQLGISVGATDTPANHYFTTVTDSVYSIPSHTPMMAWTLGMEQFSSIIGPDPIEVVYAGLGADQDYIGKDVSGKVAFVSRGNLAYVDKIAIAKNHGAKAIVIFNGNYTKNEQGEMVADLSEYIPDRDGYNGFYFGSSFDYIPTFDMQGTVGRAIAKQILSDPQTSLYFTFGDFIMDVFPGDDITDFSSRGPNADANYSIKPDISAPGNNVLSTIPYFLDSQSSYTQAYGRLSGTSMASPHVAGAAILLQQLHPEWSPFEIRAALANTAVSLSNYAGRAYDVYSQGAGRINLADAITTPALLQTVEALNIYDKYFNSLSVTNYGANASFGIIQPGDPAKSLRLQLSNISSVPVSYEASVILHDNVLSYNKEPVDYSKIQVALQGLTNNTVSADVYGKQEFTLSALALPDAENGVYEGEVVLQHASYPTLHLPFAIHVGEAAENPNGIQDLIMSNRTLELDGADDSSTKTDITFTLNDYTNKIRLEIYDAADHLVGYAGFIGNKDANGNYEIMPPCEYTFEDFNGTYTTTNIFDAAYDNATPLDAQKLLEGSYQLVVSADVWNADGETYDAIQSFGVTSNSYRVEEAARQFSPVDVNLKEVNAPVLTFPATPRIQYSVTKSSQPANVSNEGILIALPTQNLAFTLTVRVASSDKPEVFKDINLSYTLQGQNSGGNNGGGGGVIVVPPANPTEPVDTNPINANTPIVAAVMNQGQSGQVVSSTTKTEGNIVTNSISDDSLKAALEKAGKVPAAIIIGVNADADKQQAHVILTPEQIAVLLQAPAGTTVIVSNGIQAIAVPISLLKQVDTGESTRIELSPAVDQLDSLKKIHPTARFVGTPMAFGINRVKDSTVNSISVTASTFIKRAFTVNEALDSIGALTIHNGTNGVLPARAVKQSNNQTIVIINQPGLGIYSAAIRNVSFTDISSSWAKEQIQSLANKFLLNGTTSSTFSPKKELTRAEFSAMLVRALGLQASSAAPFKDVKSTDWFAADVAAAYEAGLIKGINSSTFSPNAVISRQELAVILARAGALLQLHNNNPTKQTYADANQFAGYAIDSITFVTDNGLMKGSQQGAQFKFDPSASTTREAAASVLFSLLKQANLSN